MVDKKLSVSLRRITPPKKKAMCPPKAPKIEKADPVQAAPPPVDTPQAPVLNEVGTTGTDADIANAAAKRKGKKSLVNSLTNPIPTVRPQIGVNVPI
ncbi:hypothetical protein [Rhizobium sp. BK376]|uniref:hypothetical protein n=1 Tax=Rhizobium sp. BK376 TaxID=2512149 RepID=UPI0010472760|nr:hypothetical protein [Rhizobium sp. BK376]